jgi:hypothetical protein
VDGRVIRRARPFTACAAPSAIRRQRNHAQKIIGKPYAENRTYGPKGGWGNRTHSGTGAPDYQWLRTRRCGLPSGCSRCWTPPATRHLQARDAAGPDRRHRRADRTRRHGPGHAAGQRGGPAGHRPALAADRPLRRGRARRAPGAVPGTRRTTFPPSWPPGGPPATCRPARVSRTHAPRTRAAGRTWRQTC